MGVGVDNCETLIHTQHTPAVPVDVFLRLHRDQLTDTSPDIGPAGFALLVKGATNQANFDSVSTGLLGSWYTAKSADFKAGQFKAYSALKAALGV